MSSLLILTGSPGAGKTTVASHLAKSRPTGLHVPSDVFYTFPAHPISPYRPESRDQNTAVIAAATRTACAFAERGYDVVLDGLFGPWFLPVMVEELRSMRCGAQYVVLQAPLEIALRRIQDRIGDGRDHVVRQMHAAFGDLGKYARHVVDTGSRDAETVAADLRRSLDRGEFELDL